MRAFYSYVHDFANSLFAYAIFQHWGSNLVDRKSTTGYIFMMNGGPISWASRKQTTVALSTIEAEYMALSDATREMLAHLTFFQTLSIELPIPVLYTDNEAAESIAKRQPEYQRS